MKTRHRIPAWLLLGLLAAAVIAVAACGGGGAPAGPVSFAVDESTEWGDLVGQFSGAERECIRAELGTERYGMILDQPAAKSAIWAAYPEPWAEVWEVFLWGCLAQETAVGLFWANLAAAEPKLSALFSEGPYSWSEERMLDEQCVREITAYLDFARVFAAGLPKFEDFHYVPVVEFALSIYICAALDLDDLVNQRESVDLRDSDTEFSALWGDVISLFSNADLACIRSALGERYGEFLDRAVSLSPEMWERPAWQCLSQEAFADLMLRLYDPGADYGGERDESVVGCVWRLFYETHIEGPTQFDRPQTTEATIARLLHARAAPLALLYCENVPLHGYANYHLDPVQPISISVGDVISGAVDYPLDADEFVFQAAAENAYRIEAVFEPLLDSFIEIQDANGGRMAYATNPPDSRTSQINWQAPNSGEYRIVAGSASYQTETGPYTLSLTAVPEP